MTYEDELDIQIKHLEEKLEKSKKIKAFWDSMKLNLERLYYKWKPMTNHMKNEDTKYEVSRKLEIMSIIITDAKQSSFVSKHILPLLARVDSEGNYHK